MTTPRESAPAGVLESGRDFTCPECGRTVHVDEWRLLFAGARTGGKLRVSCGPPRWSPGRRPSDGCGRVWQAYLSEGQGVETTGGRRDPTAADG
ncbi:MAG TPA: hypothetical protein VJT31_24885 [Rugosimonospora sp.]|nr:hypothetical protein [Rugosimonospora sp.]